MASQITVTYLTYSNANPTVITTATAVIPVPAALANLDSGQSASGQTGFAGFDTLLTGITNRNGVTFTDSTGTVNFVPLAQIVKIVAA